MQLLKNMEERIQKIEKQIQEIRERNEKVEFEKAWEMSIIRIGIIAAVIYVCSTLLLILLHVSNSLLSASIPTAGYFLSTMSLPIAKRWWIALMKRRR